MSKFQSQPTLSTFAVVDVETTGFSPRCNDRIIEIAVLRVLQDGKCVSEYSSLVNPDRDIGNAAVHGIRAGHVTNAPRFSDIAGDLLQVMRNAVFVAHNAMFDLRFVRSEFQRMGVHIPDVPYLCTMQLARRASRCCSRHDLDTLCAYHGILRQSSHSALDDARATAQLFRVLVDKLGIDDIVPTSSLLSRDQNCCHDSWPVVQPSGIRYPRSLASKKAQTRSSPLQSLLVRAAPSDAENAEIGEYLSVLDKVLEDRLIEDAEVDELLQLATSLGLSRHQIMSAHEQYLNALIKVALRDGRISEQERKDLDNVRVLLGVPLQRFSVLVESAQRVADAPGSTGVATGANRRSVKGKSVCFTGQLSAIVNGEVVTREMVERFAIEKEMIVKSGVSRKLDFLVAADPESLSGKAKSARELGVRILSEPVFLRMVGVQPE